MPAHATQDQESLHVHGRAHAHHHATGQGHPPAAIGPSLLRMTAAERLAVAAGLIAAIWAVVVWAMN